MPEGFWALFRVFQLDVDVVNVYGQRAIEGMVIGVDEISMVMVVELVRCLLRWRMKRLVVPLSTLV